MFQDTSDVDLMIFKGVGQDEDIIEVGHYEDVSHVSEDVIHEGLERSGSIGESHGHNQEFERAISGVKCCLPLMASSDTNIVVASPQVELGVDLGTAELVKEICDKQDRVPILPGELVEVPKVDTESEVLSFFLANRTGAPAGDWDDQMNLFPSISSRKSGRRPSSVPESG